MNEVTFPYQTIKFNEQQYKIVTDSKLENKKLILSCAGSGKTLIITARICYMIIKLKCNPENFILATFNRNAAQEMNKRICKYIGFNEVTCGTFHSLGLRLLKKYDYMFLDDEYHIDETQIIFLNFLKSERSNTLKDKIKYIFVDEFQDINDIQLKIIIELSKIGIHLFLVGDDLQNIYSFRGSNNDIILNIKKYFSKIVIDKMTINYRSTPEIINLANEIQKNNKNNFKKIIEANNESSSKPYLYVFDTLSKEINFIVSSVIADLKGGFKKRDIAILCRTNMPLFFIEEQLQKNGIRNKILNADNYLSNCISLSTIHSAKGLEWKRVYLIGMNNSYFPSPKADIEEERRLLYVAVTRAKEYLIITFNKADKVSSLLEELSEDLFKKDFNLMDIIYNNEQMPMEKQIECSVTKLISKLSGDDYIRLKKLDVFKEIDFKEEHIYDSYKYPDWIKKEDYYADFGIFVDYLIRRMIATNNKNWNNKFSGYNDKRANMVIASIFLNKSLYYKWLKYNKGLTSCIKLISQKKKISKKERLDIFKKFYKDYDVKNNKDIESIISIIYNQMNLFSLDVSEINVTNKFYIPFELKDIFTKSFIRFRQSDLGWDKIIWDIFLISKCHSVWGDRRKCLYIDISKENILSLEEFYSDISNFIEKFVSNKFVFCNPDLNNGIIYGDADLIIDDEILDIKTSSNKDMNIEHTLQLLLYTSLARSKGMKINKVSIYNPLLGKYYYSDVSKWDKEEELLEYFQNLISTS